MGHHRSTQRKVLRGREDEEHLTDNLVALVREQGRLGYWKIAAMDEMDAADFASISEVLAVWTPDK